MNASDVVEILAYLSVICASLVAIYGINAWRREYVGKKKYDLAEETLALFYEARNAVTAIRNPVGWGGEGSTRKGSEDETEDEKAILDQAYVTVERYLAHQGVFNRLLSLRYRFMARFGAETEKLFSELVKTVNQVISNANHIATVKRTWPSKGKDDSYWKMMHDAEAVVYARGDETDEIAKRVDGLIEEIEAICRRVVGRQSRWNQAAQYARTLWTRARKRFSGLRPDDPL